MIFDSFQPPCLPDDSSVSSNTSTQLEVISQNPVPSNADVVTHKSDANDCRSSQTPNMSVANNEDRHRGLLASKDVNSTTTDTNSLPDTLNKDFSAGTGKLGHRSLRIPDNTPATVISLLDSPTESGVNETPSINDPHSNDYQQIITGTSNDISIPILTETSTDTLPSASINQSFSINPVDEVTSSDLDLSMVVENPADCEPTILGTLASIRRKPSRVMRCEHEELAVLREVKKDNQNKGRKFFSCPRFEAGEQCSYFRWEEAQYLPPRLPSHRPDYVPSRMCISRDQNTNRPSTTSQLQTTLKLPREVSRVPSVTTSATEKSRPNRNGKGQQETSAQKIDRSNNGNSLEVMAEDLDPSWFLNVMEEERTRNSSAKNNINKRGNDNNNNNNHNHNNNNGNINGDSSAVVTNSGTTRNDDTPSSNSSPSDTSQSGVGNTELSRSNIPSSYESWSRVPKFSTQQLLDMISNHLRIQERHDVVREENLERIRKERDQALDELKKTQEQIGSLKRELEQSSLMNNILCSQKRLLEIENEQLEDRNKRSKLSF